MIRELLTEIDVDMAPLGHAHSREGWVNIDCPYCGNDSHKFHMGINLRNFAINCYKCGRKPLMETLRLLGASREQSLALIKGRSEQSIDWTPSTKKTAKLVMPFTKDLIKAHRLYIKEKRRLNPDKIVERWDVRSCLMKADWRIFIPIRYSGSIVSWTTRSSRPNDRLRYLSAADDQEMIAHKTLLYGEEFCDNTIIINEGPIDVWTIGYGAVATFGTSWTTAQLLRMAQYPRRIILFDSSASAQDRANELCDLLSVFSGQTINVTLETGKDANSADKAEIRELRQEFLK